jgi:chorismate mutase
MSISSAQPTSDLPLDNGAASGGTRLAALRSELDRVDDALHDGLMRRAELVAQVGALGAKGNVPLRPGREAAILRRLLARNRGKLRPTMLVRVWREIISGSTLQQRALVVAVDDPAMTAMVGGHFGLLTAVRDADGAEAALRMVQDGEANVAVLRWPGRWWTALLDGRAATLHVVARLPFWGQVDGVEAMVLTAAAPDPSGDDQTLLGGEQGPASFMAGLEDAGLGQSVRLVAGEAAGPSLAVAKGFVAADDVRLAGRARVLGAYATQMGVIG